MKTEANWPLKDGQFNIERVFAVPQRTVFQAWADIEHKQNWFIGPETWTCTRRSFDFRIGGEEVLHGRFNDGMETLYTARYHLIETNQKLVYVYDMHIDGRHLSLSLASMELNEHPRGSRMLYTEQAVYFNGEDDTKSRMHGTTAHFDRLERCL